MDELTREIYGNIGTVSKIVFYLFALGSVAVFAWGIWRRWRLWGIGRDSGERIDWRASLERLWSKVFSQRTVRKTERKAGKMHAWLFYGFIVLFIGALPDRGGGVGALCCSAAGRGTCFTRGCILSSMRSCSSWVVCCLWSGVRWSLLRMLRRGGGDTVGYRKADLWLLGSLLLIGVSGFVLEGFRIIREATPHPEISFVGWGCSLILGLVGVDHGNVSLPHFLTWWGHSLLVFGFIASLPFTRLLHIVAGSMNLCVVRKKLGHLVPISLEELEETGKTGVEHVHEFTRRQLLSLDACVACGRCTDACPATEAGKPLSPMAIVQDIRGQFNVAAPLVEAARRSGADDMQLAELEVPRLHGDVHQGGVAVVVHGLQRVLRGLPAGGQPGRFYHRHAPFRDWQW